MRNVFLLCALISYSGFAHAEAPKVPTEAPYIVLSHNLDEPNGYGFCIDSLSRGKTDLMQTHSCKPAKAGRARDDQDNDTRFAFNPDTSRVESFAFEGFCMQALLAGENPTVFALLECSNHPRQKFIFNNEDETLRFGEDEGLCVSVANETVPAGPWVKRALTLQSCDDADASLKQWTVVTK